MRLLRVGEYGKERPAVLMTDGRVLDCSELCRDYNPEFFRTNGLATLEARVGESNLPEIDVSSLRIGAPVASPQKIVCVGMNYILHVRENSRSSSDAKRGTSLHPVTRSRTSPATRSPTTFLNVSSNSNEADSGIRVRTAKHSILSARGW